MLATLLELAGLVLLVIGIRVLLGDGAALLAAGAALLVVGLAADGVHPVDATRTRWHDRKSKG